LRKEFPGEADIVVVWKASRPSKKPVSSSSALVPTDRGEDSRSGPPGRKNVETNLFNGVFLRVFQGHGTQALLFAPKSDLTDCKKHFWNIGNSSCNSPKRRSRVVDVRSGEYQIRTACREENEEPNH